MLLAGAMSSFAQTTPVAQGIVKSLKPTTITDTLQPSEAKETYRATNSSIGKGTQQLRDIPQSVTVVTERLIDDRNLDTLKDVLHNTAGVTFQAAEGGEEDIRLRGFSLATTGDIFVDGMRDPAFYERDTFNNERIELLRGSASMLFGRGSTGGAVNQVSKPTRSINESEITTTLGNFNYRRLTGDFNILTGEDAAVRINIMGTKADNNGAGSSIDKKGFAGTYRFGTGSSDEFALSAYVLINNNGMNYGIPWIRPTSTSSAETTTVNDRLDPADYFGMASDYNAGTARNVTASHIHRFDGNSELKTVIRKGNYTRDQRAGTVRMAAGTGLDNFSGATVLRRGNNPKVQDLDSVYLQSDYSQKFAALGYQHALIAGVDAARESKNVFRMSAITKPTTLAGTPNDGAWIDESLRTASMSSAFTATNWGVYAQDLVQVAPHWKLLGGLRFDSMRGAFDAVDTTGNITASYAQTISDWSQRLGLLYQPSDLLSYHFSYGTSFNTSADTYSYSALSANTPPEQSRNIEFGARIDSADKRVTTRLAIFRSTKFNERNTDPDSAATAYLLSGERHTTGLEVDITGRLTPRWEVFGSYMWMPDAMIDQAASKASAGERMGERPSLTPVHTGTLWTTYQITPELRMGGGINFRSEQSSNRNPGWMAPAFSTIDVMAEYRFSENVTLKGNASNLNNTVYADALYPGHYIPGSGRNLQATLNVKF